MNYLTRIITEPTPQSEPLDDRQVQNAASGYSYPVDDWTRMERFMILGTEGGSYYAGERKLTLENAGAARRCIQQDGKQAVDRTMEIITNNRAPRISTPLFVLAICAAEGDQETRQYAFAQLNRAAKTASHMMEFVEYTNAMRGWGRSLMSAVSNWYLEKDPRDLVYQVVKYRDRKGWTHRDLLRKSHARVDPDNQELRAIFQWLTHGDLPEYTEANRLIHAFEQARHAEPEAAAEIVRNNRMTHEMVTSELKAHPEVWDALLDDIPLNALVRNLAVMTRLGVIAPMQHERATSVIDKIGTEGAAPIHPINVLSALLNYRRGISKRGHNTWIPVSQVVDALDTAFERSFQKAPRTNARIYLGIDVSGSMTGGTVAGVDGLTPRMGATAMAMAIARREPNHVIRGFSGKNRNDPREVWMEKLDITARDSLSDAMQKVNDMPYGGTDCSLPMRDALKNNIPVDCFVILTDYETWAGGIHPMAALRQYRKRTGIPARLVTVGMVSNGFTIADPEDAGSMDVAGFDAAAPRLIAQFIAGDLKFNTGGDDEDFEAAGELE